MTKSKYKVHPCDYDSSLNATENATGKKPEHLDRENPIPLAFQMKNDDSAVKKESNQSFDQVKELEKTDKESVHRDPNLESQSNISVANDPSDSLEGDRSEDNLEAHRNIYNQVPGPPSAKDRGYAWIVVFTVYFINLVSAGYVKSFGITYILIMDYFPDASGATSGLIMGLLVGCRGLLAPAMGALAVVAGPRKVVVIGSLICVAGILLAIPSFSVLYHAFTLGAIVGTGMCMAETPGFLLVTDYFQEKRPLANGIRAAGNPTGGVLFSPMIVILNQQFGLKGALLVIAGIMLQMVVFGMLMRPFELQEKIVQGDYWRKVQRENGVSHQQIQDWRATRVSEQVEKKKKPIDFSFLWNPPYLLYLIMVLCSAAALPSALLYAPVYGRFIGLSDLENSAITSYISCSDIFMRLFCGWIFNRKKSNKRYGLIAGLLIGGLGCMTVPLSTSVWHLLVFATTFSLCMGFFWTLINVLLADQFGGENMSSTWGFFRMLQGICNFFYPTVIGFVMDISGGMTAPYILMGSMLIVAALIFASQPLVAKLPGSKIYLS